MSGRQPAVPGNPLEGTAFRLAFAHVIQPMSHKVQSDLHPMKTFLLLGTLVGSLAAGSAWADAGTAPDAESILIDALVTPTDPFNIYRPNVFDLQDVKVLTFVGTATQLPDATGAAPKPGVLVGFFDWKDEQAVEFFSPEVQFPSPADPTTGLPTFQSFPVEFTWTVAFCPREVSLHFKSLEGVFNVVGTFTHECMIPEASTVLPSAALALGMVGWAWRRRAVQA